MTMNVDRFRVRHGDRRALARHAPNETTHFQTKDAALAHLQKRIARLEELQQLLYEEDRYALLLILQGMDGAGKDHVIKHVMSGMNPQGVEVHAFKQPSADELKHDFLWRALKVLPARGRIGIFNRSYYEETLVVRVHPSLLEAERVRPGPRIWQHRFEDINAVERHLWRSGTIIRKFYLHISRKEQAQRLLARLDDPSKNWKFSPADLKERRNWPAYRAAYRDAIAATSHAHAPWYVVPADHKWFAQTLVAEVVVQALEALHLSFPRLTAAQRKHLADARRLLRAAL